MIAVDTNLLVYAHRQDCEWHEKALTCLIGVSESTGTWALPWPCIHEFLAIVTHPRIFRPPTPTAKALEAVMVWLMAPRCRAIGEGPDYFDLFQRVVKDSRASGPMVHDARIAAICIHHGVKELWTLDRDFSRFVSLKTVNPLAGGS